MRKAVFTIVSGNYLHYARTLMQSVAAVHPECHRYCVVVDTDASQAEAFADEFEVVRIEALGLPELRRFTFRYSILELNTAVKPWAFRHLRSLGHEAVVYIDPDIRLYAPMDEVFERIAAGADIVLTPHLLAPMDDDKRPTELDIRRSGAYNLGFCAVSARAETDAFLQWWQGKLTFDCVIDFERGVFVDQSWMDLVPGLFPNVSILRHPGYNVAYWNLAQRDVRSTADGWTVDGEALVFFHFSGFDVAHPARFSKHQDRLRLDTLGPVRALALDYAGEVLANGALRLRTLPYGYGVFDDGVTTIPDFFRGTYRDDADLAASMGDDPFDHPEVLWRLLPAPRPGGLSITVVMQSLLDHNADTRRAFTLADDASVLRYYEWFVGSGQREVCDPVIRIHADLLASMQAMLSRTEPATGTPLASSPHLVAEPRLLYPRGWYVGEADSASNGIWTGPDAGLPCGAASGRSVTIEGWYDGGLMQRQTGSTDCVLSVDIGDRFVGDLHLSHSGPFSLRTTMPEDLGDAAAELRIRASAHFVPHAIGLGDDRRQLAWRATLVRVGARVLLDATRDPPIAPVDRMLPVDGVNLIGYLAAESGVGESVRSFAKGCRAVGLRYATFDVGHQTSNRQQDDSLRAWPGDDRVHEISVLHVNADQTTATLATLPPAYGDTDAIAYWHWEQPELPLSALPAFAGLREVWVPSGFVRDAVAAIAPIPVFKVPHVVEFDVPPARDRARFGLPDDRFLVLMMYDFDSYQYRKNPQAAIEAYRRACGSRSDTALVVKTINGDRHPERRDELLDAVRDLPHVHLIERYLDRAEVHALEHACDCFVSLHRSEGFGLGLAEMMYLGKPVIGTDWSGNTEFMTPETSFPVRYSLEPLATPLGVYEAGPVWAEADVEHASHLLRKVVDDAPLRRSVGDAAWHHMRRHFSAARIGALYRRRLALVRARG